MPPMGDAVAVDQDLVRRVQRGDKTAFDLLVRKYQHKVIKLVSRYVYDPSDAHDVAQEAFIKAYRALPGFRGDRFSLDIQTHHPGDHTVGKLARRLKRQGEMSPTVR